MPRKLIPTTIHELEKGKLYGDLAERSREEPKPKEKLTPRLPSHLSKDARREWRFFKTILTNYGLFNIANAKHLEMLAIYSAHFRECVDSVEKTGIIVLSPKTKVPMYSPYFTAMNNIADKIQRILSDLGLGSAGLAKIGSLAARAKTEKEGIEAYLD